MRFSTVLSTGLLATSALAAPQIVARKHHSDPSEAILYSPMNGTAIQPGQTFNFTYLADSDSTTSVGLAMIHYVPLSGVYNTTSTGKGRKVTAQITVPADLAAGTYVIGVQEYSTNNPARNSSMTGYEVDYEESEGGVKRPVYVTVGGTMANSTHSSNATHSTNTTRV